jgi:hypothetical protein
MWEKEPSRQTLDARDPTQWGERVFRYARLGGILAIVGIGLWAFPRHYLLCALSPRPEILTVTGVVKAAPHGKPIPRATVYSDRDLAIADDNGVFRLTALKGAALTVDASGYEQGQSMVSNEAPVFFLLFPEKGHPAAPDEP